MSIQAHIVAIAPPPPPPPRRSGGACRNTRAVRQCTCGGVSAGGESHEARLHTCRHAHSPPWLVPVACACALAFRAEGCGMLRSAWRVESAHCAPHSLGLLCAPASRSLRHRLDWTRGSRPSPRGGGGSMLLGTHYNALPDKSLVHGGSLGACVARGPRPIVGLYRDRRLRYDTTSPFSHSVSWRGGLALQPDCVEPIAW